MGGNDGRMSTVNVACVAGTGGRLAEKESEINPSPVSTGAGLDFPAPAIGEKSWSAALLRDDRPAQPGSRSFPMVNFVNHPTRNALDRRAKIVPAGVPRHRPRRRIPDGVRVALEECP